MRKTTLWLTPVLLAAVFFSLWLSRPPAPLGLDAPEPLFSAGRAMKHVQEIARLPHPMGTAEHARVRAYILGTLSALGIEAEVQSATRLIDYGGSLTGGRIHNVVARIPGLRGERAVLVAGHYDTQPHTPGAADDGSAVAAMLETARALKTRASVLDNDVIFLFSDAEEIGLVGAHAFVEDHPLAAKVGLVINLEARGSGGVAFTFETSGQNGWIMGEYAKAVRAPFTGSVMFEIYRRMPNNTDFTVFKEAGYAGFNSAFVDGFVHYHALTDTPDRLDRGSLQHHGDTVMDLVSHFGRLDLTRPKAKDRVFFNPAGSWLLVFPGIWQTVLLALVLVLLVVVLVLGFLRGRFSLGSFLAGLLVYPLVLVLVLGVTHLGSKVFGFFYPQASHYYGHNLPGAPWFFGAFAALALLVMTLLARLAQRWLTDESLTIGALFVLVLLAGGLTYLMPTGGYVLLYPLFFPLLTWTLLLQFNLGQGQPRRYTTLVLLSLLPAVFLLTPMVRMMFVVFSIDLIPAAVALLLVLSGLLLPWLLFLGRHAFRLTAFTLTGGILLTLGAGHLATKPTARSPLHSNLCYFMDADNGRAFWSSRNLAPDQGNLTYFSDFRREALTEIFPGSHRLFLINDAPVAKLEPLEWTVTADELNQEGLRVVSVHVQSRREASLLRLQTMTVPSLASFEVDGRAVSLTSGGLQMTYHGLPREGIDLRFFLEPGKSLDLMVLELSWGLPDLPGVMPLPPEVIPDTGWFSRATVVKHRVQLRKEPYL